MENKFSERIEALREMMRERGWDAVIITGSDPHGSEFPASRWQQVMWLTGFTGEAGDVVVTLDHAGLWTDTRYFIQANEQLAGTGVVLHKTRVPEQVLIPDWLAEVFAGEEITVAVDGNAVSTSFVSEIEDCLSNGDVSVSFESVPDILDSLWSGRPPVPQTPVTIVDPGEDRQSKIGFIRSECRKNRADGILLSSLDEIAWTLNVRGSDIEYNPFVISYLLITQDDIIWFVLKGAVEDPDTEASLEELDDIRIERYDAVFPTMEEECAGMRILVDGGSLNYALSRALSESEVEAVPSVSPVALRKSVKNPMEQDMLRKAHLYDGVAMEKFLFWLEKSLAADKHITEWDAAVKLGQYRSEIPGYAGDSFETISAIGKGAALPHYITPKKDAPVLEQRGLYLCDSGGQFYDNERGIGGTTDITRTVALGECTELEMEDYTLVLKGHIDLAMAVFPTGTPGCRVDALAREPLWKYRRNFGHGTGHGVGWFLGCHEGPQDVRQNLNSQPLLPGMVLSDEPGIYREGMHGVRHENLLLCVEDEENEFGNWLRFETLTLCHFDTSAIVPELLTEEERQWLNAYNSTVRDTLAPLLPEEVAVWLEKKTMAI